MRWFADERMILWWFVLFTLFIILIEMFWASSFIQKQRDHQQQHSKKQTKKLYSTWTIILPLISIPQLIQSLNIQRQLHRQRSKLLHHPLPQPLPIKANQGINLDLPLAFQLHSLPLYPLPMQRPQHPPRTFRRILPSSVFQWCKLLLPQGLEQPESLSLLEHVEVEQLELNPVVLCGFDYLFGGGVPVLYLLLGQMVSIG